MFRTLSSEPAASRLNLVHDIRVFWLRRISAIIHSRLSSYRSTIWFGVTGFAPGPLTGLSISESFTTLWLNRASR